jgi:hypothetical protein
MCGWEPRGGEVESDGRGKQEEEAMKVKELLESLVEDQRESMAEFLYSRVPYRFVNPEDIVAENIGQPLPTPSLSFQAQRA